ncbi:MAG: hypothetical protein JRH05_11095 [Deltaproteobacteria bacterium]|nr:hypothetical protein [Deltaproteobacteria bacterium]
MTQREKEIQERYCRLIKDYAGIRHEEGLQAARSLGRDLGRYRIPAEAVVRLHREALQRFVEETPQAELKRALPRVSAGLVEALKGYEAPLREGPPAGDLAASALREADYHLRCILRKKALGNLH